MRLRSIAGACRVRSRACVRTRRVMMDFPPVTRIGQYVVFEKLGSGPWANVYKARRDGQEFRVKSLHPRGLRRGARTRIDF